MTRARFVLALLVIDVAPLAFARPASAAGTMDGYRRFASTEDARTLLEIARVTMEGRAWARADTIAWPAVPAGIYVTLTRGRETRACVGGAPPRGTLVECVRALAVEALRADRRRPPVRREELPDLAIVIAFTSAGEPVTSPWLVDPGREGLGIATERGSIAFLPGEARTVQWALDQARRAGVMASGLEPAYRRLEVVTVAERARPAATKGSHDASR
jgi:AMMECR1 domain-containing protein